MVQQAPGDLEDQVIQCHLSALEHLLVQDYQGFLKLQEDQCLLEVLPDLYHLGIRLVLLVQAVLGLLKYLYRLSIQLILEDLDFLAFQDHQVHQKNQRLQCHLWDLEVLVVQLNLDFLLIQVVLAVQQVQEIRCLPWVLQDQEIHWLLLHPENQELPNHLCYLVFLEILVFQENLLVQDCPVDQQSLGFQEYHWPQMDLADHLTQLHLLDLAVLLDLGHLEYLAFLECLDFQLVLLALVGQRFQMAQGHP